MKANEFKDYFDNRDGVLFIDPKIISRRRELKNKIWLLLKIFSGTATDKDVKWLETDTKDSKRVRNRFNKSRKMYYEAVVARDGEKCNICGLTIKLTVDHIYPLSKGGENKLENMQILCGSCNSRKGAR